MQSQLIVDVKNENLLEVVYSSTPCLNAPEIQIDEKNGESSSRLATREFANIIILSISFTMAYTSFFSIQNLQSSLNQSAGLGVLSLSLMYVACCFSSLLAAPLQNMIGVKSTILVAWGALSTYNIANFYPCWETLLPTSVAFGMLVNPLWASQAAYIAQRAATYSSLTGQKLSCVLEKFTGLFFAMFNCSILIGNVVASVILNQSETPADFKNASDGDVIITQVCGADDCPALEISRNETRRVADRQVVNILLGVFCGVILSSFLITSLLLQPLQKTVRLPTLTVLKSCCTLPFKDKRLMLVLPYAIAGSMFRAVLYAEFTKSYITCTVGIGMIGYILATFGGVATIIAFCQTCITRITGRLPLIIAVTLLQVSVLLTLLWWIPSADQLHIFFLLAVLSGIGEGTWPSQTATFHTLVFRDKIDLVFSHIIGAKSTGFALMYALSSFTCVQTKLAIAITALLVGLSLYTGAEITYVRQKRRDKYVYNTSEQNKGDDEELRDKHDEVLVPVNDENFDNVNANVTSNEFMSLVTGLYELDGDHSIRA